MLEFGGNYYYIDVAAFDKAVEPTGQKPTDKIITTSKTIYRNQLGEVTNSEEVEHIAIRGKELDPAKFDIIKTMIDIIIDYEDESDSSLGVERALDSAPLSFKLAFNTLLMHGIIKEKEIQ